MTRGRIVLSAVIILSCLAGLSTRAAAGLEWHQVVMTTLPLLNIGLEGGDTHTRNYLRGDKLRTEQEETGLVRIVDLGKRAMLVMNPSRGVYTELLLDRVVEEGRGLVPLQVEGVRAAVENLRDSLESLLEGLAEEKRGEVRERLERQLRALQYLENLKREPRVERTDELKTIAGYECRLYRKFFGGTAVEVWVAEKTSLAEELRAFSPMLGEVGLGNIGDVPPSSVLEGFPMLVVSDYLKSEVTYLEEKQLSDGLFEIPSGYKRVSVPDLGQVPTD